MSFILDLDYEDGWELIKKAFEKRQERNYWQLYVSAYPHFDKSSFMTFEQFYKKPMKTKRLSNRTRDQIIAESKMLNEKFFNKVK